MKTDVAIIGGGPGGSSSAMFLLEQGIRPLIIEQSEFPRYHIGESMTGQCGKVVRDLALEPEMLKRRYPQKQGVNVYGPNGDTRWFVGVAGRDKDWKLFDWFTWQVRRSDFDKMMLDEAVKRGATLIRGKATKPLLKDDGSVRGVQLQMADGGTLDVETELLLDCTGLATFLANHGVTGPKYLGNYDRQVAFFSQVVNTIREHDGTRECHKDNTLIFYQKKYHWGWFIPIDDEVVSVAIITPSSYYLSKKESKKDFLTRELHELNPEMTRRIPDVNLVENVHVIPNYSYQVRRFTGKGYICVGDSHRFIDPIFSFGLMISMREAQFVAPLVREYLEGKHRDKPNPFAEYAMFCEKGIDVLEDALDAFWEQPLGFALYVHHRFKELMTDVFAGRIYEHEHQPSLAVNEFRKMLKRERIYDGEDHYSVPIGSRFHPERAAMWQVGAPVESTEAWLGPR